MMKRLLAIALIVFLPVLLFLNVWQAFHYNNLVRQIGELEQKQFAVVEENKKAIAWIEVLKSPTRIQELARTTLGLKPPAREDILVIRFPEK